ncbi:MAG: ATP synthase F1 subunit epsilon [Myxococcales bacterium]|nr:ATP synthase F1 subunit epsilon [Myxococcales bacterium]|tara:strand:+ start:344 stop:748 length:405 start_codon:yes stop_codon:yes gene_type:complete
MGLNVSVLTPRRQLDLEVCDQVVAPTVLGQITVLPSHRALMSELELGKVVVERANGNNTVLAVSGGFLEVDKDRVIILVDTAETADEIDAVRAKEDLEESTAALKDLGVGDEGYEAELARFKRAELRLEVVQVN